MSATYSTRPKSVRKLLSTSVIGASAAKSHMDDTSAIFHILYIIIIDVRRTALILRGGALRVDLLRMLIVV